MSTYYVQAVLGALAVFSSFTLTILWSVYPVSQMRELRRRGSKLSHRREYEDWESQLGSLMSWERGSPSSRGTRSSLAEPGAGCAGKVQRGGRGGGPTS